MQRGFSLVELSIVLVILGLLVGGVLSGQSLIRAAELRAVTTEYQRYKAAVGTFRDKYFAIPGDMTNAQSFWGTAAACPGISTTVGGGTCNGDGNGWINNVTATNANEVFRFWQHLALAGLIEGNYTGTSGDTTASNFTAIIGINVPKSKMSNAGWAMGLPSTNPIPFSDTTYFDGTYGNSFFFGAPGAYLPSNPVLKPEEAWNIDTKLDDGKPATGIVRTLESQAGTNSSNGCSDTPSSTTATMAGSNYSLGNSSPACGLVITSGY